jgi:hypothetical protein
VVALVSVATQELVLVLAVPSVVVLALEAQSVVAPVSVAMLVPV